MELPIHGDKIGTDNGEVRQADQTLFIVLQLLDETYGWVQVLEVLRDGIASKYPSGIRYAKYLMEQ
jgi:hypothetical protein